MVAHVVLAHADQPVPPREDPNQNFTDFFSDIDSDPFRPSIGSADAARACWTRSWRTMRRSRVGWATTTGKSSTSTFSRSAIWSKRDLAVTTNFGEACATPELNLPGNSFEQNDMYPVTGKAQMDMLVMALACDLTRVASLQWSRSVSGVRFNWVQQLLR